MSIWQWLVNLVSGPVSDETRKKLNWGTDHRPFQRVVAAIQLSTMVAFLKHVEPPNASVALFPPAIIVNVPLFWMTPEPYLVGNIVDPNGETITPVFHLFLGWRRDMSNGVYYLSGEGKRTDRSKLW